MVGEYAVNHAAQEVFVVKCLGPWPRQTPEGKKQAIQEKDEVMLRVFLHSVQVMVAYFAVFLWGDSGPGAASASGSGYDYGSSEGTHSMLGYRTVRVKRHRRKKRPKLDVVHPSPKSKQAWL
jgi:hypothetical protein